MAKKEILDHNGLTVPEINDGPTSEFARYETYSREKIDQKIESSGASKGGYDWSGRNLCFEGDSLTANTVMGYPSYVCNQIKASEPSVIAISGKPVYPLRPGEASDFRRRISNIPANVDAIIILGDTNSGGESVYTMDDCYNSNPEKWAGRWNLALDAIKRSFPTVPVILCSSWVGSRSSMKIQQARYIPEALRHFCNLYGCYFINLATETPLNLLYAQSIWGLTASDQTHCNHNAMPLFANVIADRIRSIPPYKWTGVDMVEITTPTLTVANGTTGKIEYTRSGDLSLQWTSDHPEIACVMGGVVYGMAPGKATITAKTRSGKTAVCTVTVT